MRVRSRRSTSRILSLQSWGFRGTSFFFVLCGLGLFAITSANPMAMNGVRSAATDAMAPVVAAMNKPFQVTADYVNAITGIANLQKEVEALRQENDRLKEWHQTALTLQSENVRLGDLLKLKVPEPHGYISARVISDAGNTFARSIIVLAGKDDGIRKGQAVISGEGVIGRVIEDGDRASRILLLTDINSRVPIIVEGTETRAILAGQNHDFPMLDHLPPDHNIQSGQRVVTSGHGGLFLPGLPVGVTYIDDQGHVYVRLYANMDNLIYVRMIDRVVDPAILEGKIRPVAGPSKKKK